MYTHRTFAQRSDARAARSSVVFPVPASPISTVMDLAADNPDQGCSAPPGAWE